MRGSRGFFTIDEVYGVLGLDTEEKEDLVCLIFDFRFFVAEHLDSWMYR